MATMKRLRPWPSLYLVLFDCGAFKVLASEKAAVDSARFEGRDGLCCGTKGHRGEVVAYDRRRPLLGPPAGGKKPSRKGGGLFVIDGGKSR